MESGESGMSGRMSRLPDKYYEALEARLRALTPHVEILLDDESTRWFREFLDVGEYGLAVEVASEGLDRAMNRAHLQPLASGLLAEAELMGLPNEVLWPALGG